MNHCNAMGLIQRIADVLGKVSGSTTKKICLCTTDVNDQRIVYRVLNEATKLISYPYESYKYYLFTVDGDVKLTHEMLYHMIDQCRDRDCNSLNSSLNILIPSLTVINWGELDLNGMIQINTILKEQFEIEISLATENILTILNVREQDGECIASGQYDFVDNYTCETLVKLVEKICVDDNTIWIRVFEYVTNTYQHYRTMQTPYFSSLISDVEVPLKIDDVISFNGMKYIFANKLNHLIDFSLETMRTKLNEITLEEFSLAINDSTTSSDNPRLKYLSLLEFIAKQSNVELSMLRDLQKICSERPDTQLAHVRITWFYKKVVRQFNTHHVYNIVDYLIQPQSLVSNVDDKLFNYQLGFAQLFCCMSYTDRETMIINHEAINSFETLVRSLHVTNGIW
jgi:hypothetical protein